MRNCLSLFICLLFPAIVLAGESNSISGTVLDKESNEPVPFAYLHLEEVHRTTVADAEGRYELSNIPRGEFTLTVHRIGYKTQTLTVRVGLEQSNEIIQLNIALTPSLLSSQSIEVTGERAVSGSNIEHASRKFMGTDLRRDLGATLSQTLSNIPGFDQRTNGSAPGRPVIRGLGDERVMILQDGIMSGDVSAQSSDHAVTIDPVSAQEIEIARGPAALEFGSNAIGGVINVVQNQIATSLPTQINGTLSLNGETVNQGVSGALNVTVPINDFVVNADLNGRYATNTQTPAGEIGNSFFETTNDAIGLSWIQDWGYIGGSVGAYLSRYGVPPDPNGHPNGVDIEMSKFQYVAKSEYIIKGDFLNTIDLDLSLNNYNHKEFESATVIGTEFGLVSTNLNMKASHNSFGFISEGRFGFYMGIKDYAVRGASTPSSNSYNYALYLIEETDFGALHLEGGLRFDHVIRTPKEPDTGARIGNIRSRSFSALSSSFSAIYGIGNGFSVGTTLLHSFRAPSLEELFSQGPHLASYSFEIGNPELDPERGLSKELFLRYKGASTVFESTIFHNGFSNYLYAQNTGRANNRYPNLNDYQFVGTEAQLYGFEVYGEHQLTQNFLVDGSVSYTIGERDSAGVTSPLPQIPPLKFKAALKFVKGGFEIGSRIRLATEQDRTGEFETTTDGYTLLDAFTQYRLSSGRLLHTISLNVSNILNEEYYNHLSRIKDLRPEPGRNISVLYRVYF